MSDLPTEHGTTAMIKRVLAENGGIPMDRADRYTEGLDNISIDEFLRALIADCDAEELFAMLVLNENIEVADKSVKEIIVVAEDESETYFRSNP